MSYCPNCGKNVKEGSKFCPHCGILLVNTTQSYSEGYQDEVPLPHSSEQSSDSTYHADNTGINADPQDFAGSHQKYVKAPAKKEKKRRKRFIIFMGSILLTAAAVFAVIAYINNSDIYSGKTSATRTGVYKDTILFRKEEKVGITITKDIKRFSMGNKYRLDCKVEIENQSEPDLQTDDIDGITLTDITNYKMIKPQIFSAVFDSETGECLECKNDHDVTFKKLHGGWKSNYYLDDSLDVAGYKIPFAIERYSSIEFEVTYPKNYRHVAIAAGFVNTTADECEKDNDFWKGSKSYTDTVFFKKGNDTVLYTGFEKKPEKTSEDISDSSEKKSDDKKGSYETSQPSEKSEDKTALPEPTESYDRSKTTYKSIYSDYKERLEINTPKYVREYKRRSGRYGNNINKCARLSNSLVKKLALIENDGTEKMADLMVKNGDNYNEYERWAKRLYKVYERCSLKITNAYENGVTDNLTNSLF